MNVTFIQSADPVFYYRMLQETSRTVRAYCFENGFAYESYVGIKRGVVPWNAAYNRTYMLKELVDRGNMGWVFYMDADAYISDLNFDLRSFLADKHHLAGIFAGYLDGTTPHNINSGGFAVNLGHVAGRHLAIDYWRAEEAIPEADFRRAIVWGADFHEDQYMLHRLLDRYCAEEMIGDAFLFERAEEGYHTNHGMFIRQALRSASPDFASRMDGIRAEIGRAMQGRAERTGEEQPGYFLTAAHPALRLGVGIRIAGAIATSGRAGCLTFGPYVTLQPGRYAIKIFGEARPTNDGGPIILESDIAFDQGTRVIASERRVLDPGRGLLLAYEAHIAEPTPGVEVRTVVDAQQNLLVTAIQFQWIDAWVREN